MKGDKRQRKANQFVHRIFLKCYAMLVAFKKAHNGYFAGVGIGIFTIPGRGNVSCCLSTDLWFYLSMCNRNVTFICSLCNGGLPSKSDELKYF